MDQSSSIAIIFGTIIAFGLLGSAAAIWYEFRNN